MPYSFCFPKYMTGEGLPHIFHPQAKTWNKDKHRELATSANFAHWNFLVSPNLLLRNTEVQFELWLTKGTEDNTVIWKVYCSI